MNLKTCFGLIGDQTLQCPLHLNIPDKLNYWLILILKGGIVKVNY